MSKTIKAESLFGGLSDHLPGEATWLASFAHHVHLPALRPGWLDFLLVLLVLPTHLVRHLRHLRHPHHLRRFVDRTVRPF